MEKDPAYLKMMKHFKESEPEQLEFLDGPAISYEDAAAPPPLVLDPEQCDAVYLLWNAPIGIITGGPGRGKTRSLQAALPFMGSSVALCAPSGKAARRMAELTGHTASTVHRLLGLQPESTACMFHRGNPLPYKVVVVDEASTLDNALCAKLLDACDVEHTRVFFIGDVDQLPSVGPGQVLLDLIESDAVPVVRLKTMHRSAAKSWVCRMAPEILAGRIDLTKAPDFLHVEADTNLVAKTVCIAMEFARELSPEDYQVVVPMNVGDYGAQVLNPALQEALNPRSGPFVSFSAGGARVRVGDPVVVIDNDYEKAVFNGETGRVHFIDDGTNGMVIVDFVDRRVEYTKPEASEHLRLSYALTVHKMQGSEVGCVILVLHEAHSPLLSRKLLYTAVTRAKKSVVIVGQRSAILRAVAIEDTTRRITNLRARLEAGGAAG